MAVICRKLCWILSLALAVTVAFRAAAEEESDGSEFIDMPDSYYEQKREESREEQQSKGDVKEKPGYVPGYLRTPGLGLSPHAPQMIPAMPGALTPSFGAPTRDRGMRFEFHGYLQAAARAGVGEREGVADEFRTTLHADPVVPGGSYGWFDHSNTVPTPWAQLNFIYGNDLVKTTAILGAWSVTEADEAAGSFMGHAQQLFTNVFLTYTPDVRPIGLTFNIGVFPDRYGFMSKWHQGAYGASLIGDIYGMGFTGTVELPFEGDFTVIAEGGLKGEFDKVPFDLAQDGSNEYARAEEGSTFAGHAHVGLHFAKHFNPTLHFIQSWSQDDRGDLPDDPSTPENDAQSHKDGSLRVLGGDMRIDGERFGYFYLGGSQVEGEHANAITDMVKILNAGSGKELNERYWGFASNGNGRLTLIGTQYTLSLGTLLRHPMEYWGVGPDLTVSLFAIFGRSDSDVNDFDRNMFKYGVEAVYSFSRYLAASMRIDHVMPDLEDSGRSFGVFSPKLIVRSDWVTREALTLQYAYFTIGDDVLVQGDNRLMNVASDNPDHHMVALYGTVWW